jgi:hypothetical protein
MFSLICKHQEMMVDNNTGISVSACRNPKATRTHEMVSELICKDCRLCEEPSVEVQHLHAEMHELRGGNLLKIRPLAERNRILETYCLKCKHCDSVSKICGGCDCSIKPPVDDYVKYEDLHCPLELW